ncbi:MAG: hypothetical protein WBW61_12430 [Rhodanobacteraceae bacterium]
MRPRTHADTERLLRRLESQLIDMIADHLDERDFWAAFIGEAVWIRDAAAADDMAYVDERVRDMLNGVGLSMPDPSQPAIDPVG